MWSPTSGWCCVLRPALVPETVPPSSRFGPAPSCWVPLLRAWCVWGASTVCSERGLCLRFSCIFLRDVVTLWVKSVLSNETGSRSPCMRPRSDPPKMKNSNVVRSRLIILINEEINEANWMVNNSAKLDRRTKQHTQFGVSASNGSRDMAQTKSWQKKRKKNNKKTNEANWMVTTVHN